MGGASSKQFQLCCAKPRGRRVAISITRRRGESRATDKRVSNFEEMGKRKGKKGGKKKGKNAAKKAARKAADAALIAAQSAVRSARDGEDPFADGMEIPGVSKRFGEGEDAVELEYVRVEEMEDDDLVWAFGLLKANMETHYQESGWGWNDTVKQEEMQMDGMRYIIIRRASDGERLGYAEFQYSIEDGLGTSVFLYEIQLAPDVRRRGLGRLLMDTLESLSAFHGIEHSLLTVFSANTSAMDFYLALGYVSNPDVDGAADTWNADLGIHEPPAWHIMHKVLQTQSTPQSDAEGGAPQSDAEGGAPQSDA